MSVTRTYAVGAYATGEQSVVMVSTRYVGGGPIVLVCPGVAGFAHDYTMVLPASHIDWFRRLTRLAEAGCVVCVGTFAAQGDGGSSWGNIHGRDLMDDAIAMCVSAYGGDDSRIGILGDSEGGDLALNYAWRHTSTVQAVVTYLTPPNVDSLYAINSIVEDTVDTAFDDLGGWQANKAAHDPALNYSSIRPIADRILMHYSNNDGLAPQDQHLALAAATGVEVVSVGTVMHDVQTTGAVNLEQMVTHMLSRLF